ncbi:MAG: hypothetical protein AB7Q17_07510 [Phycisphaerae bacterium]
MFEVYAGSRPGRPALLLVLLSASLVGSLGLAWWQVRSARALAPERRIGDSPLHARPPRDWSADPREPGSFRLPIAETFLGRRRVVIERRVTFGYLRVPHFRHPQSLVNDFDRLENAQSGPARPVRVAGFTGVQVVRRRPVPLAGRIFPQTTILRLACTPRGDVVYVEYIPLPDAGAGGRSVGVPSPADEDLLDDLCAAMRLDEPGLTLDPGAGLALAGVAAPLPAHARVVAPDLPEAPGAYVGFSPNDAPGFAIGVFRTWVAPGRTPAALLADLAAGVWEVLPTQVELSEGARADGLRFAVAHRRLKSGDATILASARVVGEAVGPAVMLLVYTDEARATAAEEAARELTEALRLLPLGAMPDPVAAQQRGAELVDVLTRKGPIGWWGREWRRFYYAGARRGGLASEARGQEYLDRTSMPERCVVIEREAIERDPLQGYRGFMLDVYDDQQDIERWDIDGRGVGYGLRWDGAFGGSANPALLRVRERRLASGATVARELDLNARHWKLEFSPGPAFVASPLESLAHAWAAHQSSDVLLLEISTRAGAGSATQLLRPMPAGDGGAARLFVQLDYWPLGVSMTFDDDYELIRYETGLYRLARGSQIELERRFPELRAMLFRLSGRAE